MDDESESVDSHVTIEEQILSAANSSTAETVLQGFSIATNEAKKDLLRQALVE